MNKKKSSRPDDIYERDKDGIEQDEFPAHIAIIPTLFRPRKYAAAIMTWNELESRYVIGQHRLHFTSRQAAEKEAQLIAKQEIR